MLVLGLLVALGPLTIDAYLPALPSIRDDLGSTDAAVQLTLTATLAGVAVGQLVHGPLSDAHGRRRPLLAGVALHVLASALCVVAPSVEVLTVLRVLQGLGSAAASVIAYAVVRDLFEGHEVARVLSRLILVLGLAPVLAPTLGGEVLRHTTWPGVFVVLALVGLALLVLAATQLPETLPPARRRATGVRSSLAAYRGLLRDRTYVGLIVVSGSAFAALFAYVSGSSFVYQEQYGLSEQAFALLFGAGSVALIGATQVNLRLLRTRSPEQALGLALGLGVAAAAVLVAVGLVDLGLAGFVLPLWVVLLAVGLTMPNAPALALGRHGEAAGTAAALHGFAMFGLAAAVAPLVGVLGGDAVALSLVVLGTLLVAAVVLRAVVLPGLREAPAPVDAR